MCRPPNFKEHRRLPPYIPEAPTLPSDFLLYSNLYSEERPHNYGVWLRPNEALRKSIQDDDIGPEWDGLVPPDLNREADAHVERGDAGNCEICSAYEPLGRGRRVRLVALTGGNENDGLVAEWDVESADNTSVVTAPVNAVQVGSAARQAGTDSGTLELFALGRLLCSGHAHRELRGLRTIRRCSEFGHDLLLSTRFLLQNAMRISRQGSADFQTDMHSPPWLSNSTCCITTYILKSVPITPPEQAAFFALPS